MHCKPCPFADLNEQTSLAVSITPRLPQTIHRTGTKKGRKGVLGSLSNILGLNKTLEIGTPSDLVPVTHVAFDTSTEQFTRLPEELQHLVQDRDVIRVERETNPEAVLEIVKFYQEGGADLWDKLGDAPAPPLDEKDPSSDLESQVRPLSPLRNTTGGILNDLFKERMWMSSTDTLGMEPADLERRVDYPWPRRFPYQTTHT